MRSTQPPSFAFSFFSVANAVLRWIVVGVAAYIVLTPLLPGAWIFFQRLRDRTEGYAYDSRLARNAASNIDASALRPMPEVNTIVIPKIGVHAPIVEGATARALDHGAWRRPGSSTPQHGGNTVLAAHRYLHMSGSNTFYHLDELRVGDTFLIVWNGQEYDYVVQDVRVVGDSAVDIEYPTSEPIVTLYTCTPLWTSDKRLVVRAKPLDLPENI